MAVAFYGRRGDADTVAAQKFLQAHRYRADTTLDIDVGPLPWQEIRKAFSDSLWPTVDPRHPGYGEWFPRGAEGVDEVDLERLLVQHPSLRRAPLLITPKGGLAGFREQKWRAFLDIGKERA